MWVAFFCVQVSDFFLPHLKNSYYCHLFITSLSPRLNQLSSRDSQNYTIKQLIRTCTALTLTKLRQKSPRANKQHVCFNLTSLLREGSDIRSFLSEEQVWISSFFSIAGCLKEDNLSFCFRKTGGRVDEKSIDFHTEKLLILLQKIVSSSCNVCIFILAFYDQSAWKC